MRATYAFVKELLSLVAERRATVLAIAQRSDAALRAGGVKALIPVRAALSTNRSDDVVYEDLDSARTTDSTRREPGVRAGMRRTGRYHTLRVPIYDRFTPTLSRPVPWGYAIAPTDTTAINLVRLHGIVAERLATPCSGNAGPQFAVDSTTTVQDLAPRRQFGRWVEGRPVSLPTGTWMVRTAQPLGVLAMYLLEPESDDGLVAWDIGARASKPAGTAPVIRLADAIPGCTVQGR